MATETTGRAWNLTRMDMHYRHDVFSAGLRAAGYEVRKDAPVGKPGDLLLIWNRYGAFHDQAVAFESAGGVVVVAENGYIGKDADGHQLYALALHGHNGSGTWPDGGPARWASLGVNLAPWRADGGHVLVCPNRSFGTPGRIQPPDWANDVRRRLEKLTKREVRIRPHPGNDAPRKPLSEDLAGCWCVVIWSSSAGVHALAAGIPVVCCAPAWICMPAAGRALHMEVDTPYMSDKARLEALQRLAWAQWSIQEIATGEPFRYLLRRTDEAKVAASA